MRVLLWLIAFFELITVSICVILLDGTVGKTKLYIFFFRFWKIIAMMKLTFYTLFLFIWRPKKRLTTGPVCVLVANKYADASLICGIVISVKSCDMYTLSKIRTAALRGKKDDPRILFLCVPPKMPPIVNYQWTATSRKIGVPYCTIVGCKLIRV